VIADLIKTVIDSCLPKKDVLEGSIDDTVFAADLYAVYRGMAPPIYQDPQKFFDNTYPTEGLKELLSEVFGRLSETRPDANPVIKLETSMGGGKTHDLIALYHISKSGRAIRNISQFLREDMVPSEGVRLAVLAAIEYGASSTGRMGEVAPKTLWGELAYQLGGPKGYELVAGPDKEWQAPGASVLENLFELCGEPVLILIDELPTYLAGIRPGPKQSTGVQFVKQVTVFLQQLLQVASRRKRVVVVLSLTTSKDPYKEEAEIIVSTIEKVASKFSRSIFPSRENEIVSVIKKRLFEKVDPYVAKEAASAYLEFYRGEERRGIPLPPHAVKVEYKDLLERSYPLHPELMSILDDKLSTIPNFQKTRGALRLLVRTIRRYWKDGKRSSFIMPYDINLEDEEIQTELTGKLDREQFRPVIQSDIYSRKGSAKAQEVDGGSKVPVAKMTATSIFLYSLVEGQPGGIDKSTLYLATIGPQIKTEQAKKDSSSIDYEVASTAVKPEDVDRALEALLDINRGCWYLYGTGNKYVFRTEPSITKVIQEEIGNISLVEAKQRAETVIRKKFESSFFDTRFFPAGPADVPDDPERLKLVVIHWDSGTATRGSPPPELVPRIFERAGQMESFRIYKNNVLFLVADSGGKDEMIEHAKRDLALERIRGNKDLMSSLSQDLRKKLENRKNTGELDLVVAVLSTYRHLYYPPRASGLGEEEGLRQLSLKVDEGAEVHKRNQQEVILEALEREDKVIRGGAKPLSSDYVFDRAWNPGERLVSTLELKRRFAKKPNLPILLDPNVCKAFIRDGVEKGLWVYQMGESVYEKGSTPIPIQLDENALLFLPDEAKKRGITAVKKEGEGVEEERCPICGKVLSECTCSTVTTSWPRELKSSGDVERAFRDLLETVKERKVARFKEIGFSVGDIQGLRALGLLIPQLGKAKTTVDLSYESGSERGTSLTVAFNGSWDNYKEIKEFIERASKPFPPTHVNVTFNVSFPAPIEVSEEVERIKGLLKKFETNSITIRAVPGE
jgi:hypothetical protein